MKRKYLILTIIAIALIAGCITQFIPETDESADLLVVEGLITDQNKKHSIKISKTLSLGKYVAPKPVKGAIVTITDGNYTTYTLKEYPSGTYTTDSTIFSARVGGTYTLKIITGGRTYLSERMVMRPVPPIDSVFYEKVTITDAASFGEREEGCRIYLNTHDPEGRCFYYRWDYVETWSFSIPYQIPNYRCWITQPSDDIHIKNTSVYEQSKVTRYPLLYITNETDRLKEKYSILVRQYSLTQNEYNYWEKLQNVYQNVGGLYDVTPMAIPSNIFNQNNRDEIVLGYFSVSAVAEKRIFIRDVFAGMPSLYNNCASDTIDGPRSVVIPGLNVNVWVIADHTGEIPPYRVITYSRECADCTTRGSSVKPSFWE